MSGSGVGRKARKGRKAAKDGDALDPDLRALCELLIERFGTKVEIRGDMKRGSIIVEYYSSDDLQRILETVGEG